jgi:DNA mismatch repair protein MutS
VGRPASRSEPTSTEQAAERSNEPLGPERLTPAMEQYLQQKKEVGDALLLFRMGDFYELFYDDAHIAARVLGITLTSRDGGKTPLAGIPHQALETYLARLVGAGYRVAISEQIEDPRLARGIVKRAVVRIVTPGTLTEEALLDRTVSNLLAAVLERGDQAGLAALELSTGAFEVQLVSAKRLLDELVRLAPAEVLLPDDGTGPSPLEREIRERLAAAVTYHTALDFAPARAEQLIREQFETAGLEGFGFDRVDLSLQAAGALLAYVRQTQKTLPVHLRPPRRRALDEYLVLDPVTLRSLEIERTLRGGSRAGSLFSAVDRTCNPMGTRLLRNWLCYPLRDLARITARQRLIGALRAAGPVRERLRQALRQIGDIERIVGRLGVKRSNPRELRSLGESLKQLGTIRQLLGQLGDPEADRLAGQLDGLEELSARLCAALRPDAPVSLRDGGIFADGYHPELDRLRGVDSAAAGWLAEFQAREVQRTGIPSLRVSYNRVFGYYIEVTNPHRHRVPPDYIRKQTVKNAERYVTEELKQREQEILSAQTRARELEYELFTALRDEVVAYIPALARAAVALAELDVLAGWAELARRENYTCPEFVDEPVLEIEQGRHPVVSQVLGSSFVPNDTYLRAGGQSLALITGPNMAGKSTYIRQVALLALLAHCGCWVPARRFRLGLIDRIFTRVGASDELARGQSTFLVEMLETANILHNATFQSLVILDEVGRGTSTFDGIALAWAITEHLATVCRCRTLFATHYHELTELAGLLPSVFNLTAQVREYEDQVVFLHRIEPGAADRSYGLHVAKLAGLPRQVLERANAVLNELERNFARQSQRPVLAAVQRRRLRQLRLFEEPEELIVRELRQLGPLEPAKAAEQIARWQALLEKEQPEKDSCPG